LPSAGLHTNGYSLARRVLGDDMQVILPAIGKVGEALLAPHISYLKPLLPLVDDRMLRALAHITGGGLTDNVPRVLPQSLDAKVKLESWPSLSIFNTIYDIGGVGPEVLTRVYYM